MEALNRFLIVLILTGTRAVLITKVPSGIYYFHALGFQLLPILDLFLIVLAC